MTFFDIELIERITEDHVVLFEQTLAKNCEVISEDQKLPEELKQKDEENSSCRKTGTTQESADCPLNLNERMSKFRHLVG